MSRCLDHSIQILYRRPLILFFSPMLELNLLSGYKWNLLEWVARYLHLGLFPVTMPLHSMSYPSPVSFSLESLRVRTCQHGADSPVRYEHLHFGHVPWLSSFIYGMANSSSNEPSSYFMSMNLRFFFLDNLSVSQVMRREAH